MPVSQAPFVDHARQVPLLGLNGQADLAAARVLVIGAGGLGCPVASALAAAGVRRLTVMDPDVVEESNRHRQLLYGPKDVGQAKARLAKRRLEAWFPDCHVDDMQELFEPANAATLVRAHDLVIEGTDTAEARYAASDACQEAGIPLVTGAVERWHGQVAFLLPGQGCYRCLWPEPGNAPNCAEAGIVPTQTGLVGHWMAQVALQYLAGSRAAEPALWIQDGHEGSMGLVPVQVRPSCKCQDGGATRAAAAPNAGIPPRGRLDVANPQSPSQDAPSVIPETTPHDLRAALQQGDEALFVLDVRENDERARIHIEGDHAHIPLMQVPDRMSELPKSRRIVVYCAVGGRSAQATAFLRQQGLDAVNLHGGMHGWQATAPPA